MASIVDSFRDILGDRYSFFKILVFSIAVYFDYNLYLNYQKDPISFNILTAVIAFFLFGVFIKITNNIINERTDILPSLNPIKLGYTAYKGILALLPATLISCYLANLVSSLLNTIPWFDYTIKSIAWIIAITIILSSYLMFAANEKIKEAFKLGILSEKAGDLIVTVLVLVIQLILINAITVGFIGYTIMILFGPGPILNFVMSLALVYNICAIGHYIGQLYYETITYGRN